MRSVFLAAGLTILFSAPLSAQLSGSWRGTYTISIVCANGSSFDSAGLAAAVLEESPDRDVTGTLLVDDFLFGDIATCTPQSRAPASFALTGRVSGSSFTGAASVLGIVVPLSGTVTENQFSATVQSNLATGGFTFTRDTASVPDLTGTWSGAIGGVIVCDGEPIPQQKGPVTVWLRQNGDQIAGTAVAYILYVDPWTCEVEGPVSIPMGMIATVNGNVLRGYLTTLWGDKPLVASIGPTSIVAAATDAGASATLSLTKTDSIDPPSEWSGVWKGTATTEESVAWACANMNTLRYDEVVSVTILHLGNAFFGSGTASGARYVVPDANRNCTVVQEPPVSFTVAGLVQGSESAGAFVFEDTLADFHGQFTGNTFSGVTGDGEDQSTFSLTRQEPTGNAPVMITSFTARPATIRPGQAVELRWVTAYANSVTIAPGVGSLPPKGTVSVHPSETTTYTLTATGSDMASAYCSVTVKAPVTGRRRAVRH
ncbi:MAG TPA: hypothetical protein VNA69_15485 [Thermoanaerobaculia bacterium]|nr:hypothetical protein [Thermoanaerobaculia bacterium]